MGILQIDIAADRSLSARCADVSVVACEPETCGREIAALMGACAAADGQRSQGPVIARFEAELASRPGRRVRAWLARLRSDAGQAGYRAGSVVGLVALVISGDRNSQRYSIGWLLVEPAFRRRGIGRALVAAAVEAARDGGATVVHAETSDRWPAAVAFWQATQLAAEQAVARLSASGESRKTAEG